MIKRRRGILRIGTSGIVVPGPKNSFPIEFQQKSRLNFYSSALTTLEVNSTFYKVPMQSTFEKWSLDVPEDFQFTIKLWREITHVKELKIDLDRIDMFLEAAARIGDKKGCILIQFPGKITFEYYNQVEEILLRLQKLHKQHSWRRAVEFRNASWYVSETFELLDECDASLVLHDIPKARNTLTNKAAKFVYLRFHGPKGDYRGSYGYDFLAEQYERIDNWLMAGKDVYAYFNNTMGTALEDAMMLKKIAGR